MQVQYHVPHSTSSKSIFVTAAPTHHPVLELAILSTNTSVAPQAVSSSIALAILSFSTIELTDAHSGSSSAWIVGARFPGVIFVAFSSRRRGMLYMQRTCFWAAVGERGISGELLGEKKGWKAWYL